MGSCPNDNGALELYPLYPKISEPEAGAAGPGASAKNVSLDLCGNQWSRDVPLELMLNLVHPCGAQLLYLFTIPAPYNGKNIVSYVHLFFHKRLFTTYKHSWTQQRQDFGAENVTEVVMHFFDGIMFAMSLWLFVLWATWKSSGLSKMMVYSLYSTAFNMFEVQAASVFQCCTHVVSQHLNGTQHGKRRGRRWDYHRQWWVWHLSIDIWPLGTSKTRKSRPWRLPTQWRWLCVLPSAGGGGEVVTVTRCTLCCRLP